MPSSSRLAIMPRPYGGDWLDDEIAGWRAERIDIVVSLLESDEVSELGLGREEELCKKCEMEFISFPILDRGVPVSLGETANVARMIALRIREGKGVAIHCRAGIGRSSLIAACALVSSGVTPDAAFEIIGKARGVKVPDNDGQRDWVERFHEATISLQSKAAPKTARRSSPG
jgi:protein-tyrosine phosphatase